MGTESKKNFSSKLREFIKEYLYIPVTIFVTVFVFNFILIIGTIPTASMEPTYMTGSAFIGVRIVPDRYEIERGTPVLFHMGDEIWLKRIVGVPGDTVSFANGKVFVNDEELDESGYLPYGTATWPGAISSFQVPARSYFVMGDNRDNSYDSRYWEYSFVSAEDIVGTLVGVVHIPGWN